MPDEFEKFDFSTGGAPEPSALARQAAKLIRENVNAMVEQGFTVEQALYFLAKYAAGCSGS